MSQQPIEVFPSPPNIPTQSYNSSHSNESFGPVLIVLAVIVVLLLISIVLGRICNKRYRNSKAEQSHGHGSHKKAKSAKKNGGKFHHEGGDIGDIEFGFDKRFASSKVGANGGDHFKVPKIVPQVREPKGAVRFADDHIEFGAGA
ncbi:hypothetical protein ACH5RR_030701 [Cinchona calisaya]|uniref:Transmembrane protein n=1 Tax=Cinchona calisaya TaxID=153742 RepID=A0ABD2YZ12_9GENT